MESAIPKQLQLLQQPGIKHRRIYQEHFLMAFPEEENK